MHDVLDLPTLKTHANLGATGATDHCRHLHEVRAISGGGANLPNETYLSHCAIYKKQKYHYIHGLHREFDSLKPPLQFGYYYTTPLLPVCFAELRVCPLFLRRQAFPTIMQTHASIDQVDAGPPEASRKLSIPLPKGHSLRTQSSQKGWMDGYGCCQPVLLEVS